jgi:hypothetical protein
MRDAWRAARRMPNFYALAIANLYPLAGLALLGWRADKLVLFYMLESIVVYLLTAKMLGFVSEQRDLRIVRRFMTSGALGIFMMGVFWAFVFRATDVGAILAMPDFAWSVLYMAAIHVFSYYRDFIGQKEYERLPVNAIEARWGGMFFGVLVVMLVAPLLFLLHSPGPFAGTLVIVKTAVALSGFVEERARAQGSEATSIAYTRPTATCPRCGGTLRTNEAKQCYHCGADWHAQESGGSAVGPINGANK